MKAMTENMELSIETPTIRDVEHLVRIEKECFDEEAFSKQHVLNLVTSYNSITLVAKNKEKIIGFIIGTIYYERKELVGHVLTIDVSKGYRRKGIAMILLDKIEEMFRGQSVAACGLEVREDNIPAIRLYEKTGYTRIALLENYYGRINGLYFRKSLV
jgi:ribosomal-protein-alanine acetyltransferase